MSHKDRWRQTDTLNLGVAEPPAHHWSWFEAAWTYRFPAWVTRIIRARLEALPDPIRAVAWKAQVRRSGRYRKLVERHQ